MTGTYSVKAPQQDNYPGSICAVWAEFVEDGIVLEYHIVVNEKLQAPGGLRRVLRQKMCYLNRYWESDWQKLTENDLDKLLEQVNFVWSIDKSNADDI